VGIEEGRSLLGAFQSQKEARGRVASSYGQSTARVAARAGTGATCPCEEEPAGLGERASWGPGGAGRAGRGQLVAGGNTGDGRQAALQRNREGEAGGRR
jgi:hypothetical protein